MNTFIRRVFLLVSVMLSACSTMPEGALRLNEVQTDSRVITLPIDIQDNGLFLVKGIRIGDKDFAFILDTGATRSAMFESAFDDIPQDLEVDRTVNIHGLAEIAQRDIIRVSDFQLGHLSIPEIALVKLPDRDRNPRLNRLNVQVHGLIGMDILSDYTLYVSRERSELTLIPNDIYLRLPPYWSKINLYENPFKDEDRGLHFFNMKILSDEVSSLLDTGAEINVMNWNDVQHPKLRSWYKKMRANWEIQGAVGQFSPKIKVNLEGLQAGSMIWGQKEFIVTELESLDILGVGGNPFFVVGLNLFDGDEMVIDFERNRLYSKPDTKHRGRKIIRKSNSIVSSSES